MRARMNSFVELPSAIPLELKVCGATQIRAIDFERFEDVSNAMLLVAKI